MLLIYLWFAFRTSPATAAASAGRLRCPEQKAVTIHELGIPQNGSQYDSYAGRACWHRNSGPRAPTLEHTLCIPLD
jgi:hypothetical protein